MYEGYWNPGGVRVFIGGLQTVRLQRVQQCASKSSNGIKDNHQENLGQDILESTSPSSAICPDTSRTMTQGPEIGLQWDFWKSYLIFVSYIAGIS